MKPIHRPQLSQLSFPDYEVLKWSWDPSGRRLEVQMDGAWLDENGGQKLGPGPLIVEAWVDACVEAYDSQSETWSDVAVPPDMRLKDLCEVSFDEEVMVLCGFAVGSGAWTRFTFRGARASYGA